MSGMPCRRTASVLLESASFRYVDQSEAADGAACDVRHGVAGSFVDDISFEIKPGACTVLCGR